MVLVISGCMTSSSQHVRLLSLRRAAHAGKDSGLDGARISHPGFEGLLAASGAKFVYVLDPDRPEGRTWDNSGRVEDVATGSAAGPAAGYLLHHGVCPAMEPILVHQGRFTGRPSTIEVRPGPDGRLWVGGPVAPVAAGRFHADLA